MQWYCVQFEYGVAKNVFAIDAMEAIKRATASFTSERVKPVSVTPLGGLA